MDDKKKRMKMLGYLLVLHGTIIPGIIIVFGDAFTKNKDYVFLSIGVALLWAFIFSRMYIKKITKLKQEIDARQQK